MPPSSNETTADIFLRLEKEGQGPLALVLDEYFAAMAIQGYCQLDQYLDRSFRITSYFVQIHRGNARNYFVRMNSAHSAVSGEIRRRMNLENIKRRDCDTEEEPVEQLLLVQIRLVVIGLVVLLGLCGVVCGLEFTYFRFKEYFQLRSSGYDFSMNSTSSFV